MKSRVATIGPRLFLGPALAWTLLSLFNHSPLAAPLAAWPDTGFARGLVYSSWDGSYRHQEAWSRHLDQFESMGVTWLEVMTFAHQPKVDGPKIKPSPEERWPREFIRAARRRGVKILLKPHVWSRQFYDGSNRWRGSIKMRSEDDWAEWFRQYEAFILREAKLAESFGVEMLSIGLEYVEATKRPAHWRRLISKIRQVYSGSLTYAADGNHELGHITFWDHLDVIGVDAYFALSGPYSLFGGGLLLSWVEHMVAMETLATRYRKPIIFTEAGYPSTENATLTPWRWPKGDETVALEEQALAYEALLMTLTTRPWFQGVFWWKWYERQERGVSHSHDYSPRGKPAEAVLKRWYRGQR